MGAWGVLAFDNDTANDWAYRLDDVSDLSLVVAALEHVEEVGDDYLSSDLACVALAACEVMARLRGKPGYCNAYTENVDDWVAAHPQAPPHTLIERGTRVIERVLGDKSELASLWDLDDGTEWRASVEDLRRRLTT